MTPEQTASLFDNGTLPRSDNYYRAKDVEEMNGYFLMFNYMLDTLEEDLSQELIKQFHYELKSGVFEKSKVLVMDDADFALSDESGRIFPAEMLLGWDVISRYRWSYSTKDESLSVSLPERTAEHLSPEIKHGPVVSPEYAGRCFAARVDTGHTGSILSASWYSRLPDIAYHETEIAGVGTSQYKRIPYVRTLQLLFQNQTITLQDVDICDKLYGQSAEIEALLGYDFLEGRDWLLEQAFRLLP